MLSEKQLMDSTNPQVIATMMLIEEVRQLKMLIEGSLPSSISLEVPVVEVVKKKRGRQPKEVKK